MLKNTDRKQTDLFLDPPRSATLPPSVPENAKSRRDNVWQLMKDGHWHTTMEINAVDVGGSEGCRRLRELRRLVRNGTLFGQDIIKEKISGSNQWMYRLLLGAKKQD